MEGKKSRKLGFFEKRVQYGVRKKADDEGFETRYKKTLKGIRGGPTGQD